MPESETRRMFRPVPQVDAPVRRQTTLFGQDHPVAAPRDEVCRLRLGLHLALMHIRYWAGQLQL